MKSGLSSTPVRNPTYTADVLSFTDPEPGSLQHQLNEITANTSALVPPERLERLARIIADLHATGIEDHCISTGSIAPSFRLLAATGKPVASSDLLALGPLVLKFFRGRWDPYDMTELAAWEALQPTLRSHRALFVAISPQIPRQNAFTADRHHFTFPLLTDPACTVAEQFGIVHTIPEPTQAYYRSILVNIPFLNGDNSWHLPLPATFVLNPQGRVVFAEAHADHRLRPEPHQVLRALEAAAARPIADR